MKEGLAGSEAMKKRPSSIARFLERVTPGKLAALVFAVYLVAGLLVVQDYGISADEATERRTSLVNYVSVLGRERLASGSESVQGVVDSVPDMPAYLNRFYGAALQCLTVIVEHARNFAMTTRDIFLLRHAFTFFNYFLAGIFFTLILRRRFGNTWAPFWGTLLYILYPRFFGEAFYNIKDILFYAWMIIAAYFVLRWLEGGGFKFTLSAAMALAITINTRILGLSLLLLGCAFTVIVEMRKRAGFRRVIGKPAILGLLTFVCYVAITPFLWENPLQNAYRTFLHFMDFEPWIGRHFYLGEMITREVPWHYIPVWMGVTVPLLYHALFLIGVAVVCAGIFASIRRKGKGVKAAGGEGGQPGSAALTLPSRAYDLFFAVLFFATLLGYMALHISMYEGWRHGYGIFFPFLYLAILGLERAFAVARGKGKALRYGLTCAVAACLMYQLVWIVGNHPYQYVYFNALARPFAEENFALDYWHVSHVDLVQYALAHDDRPQIIIGGSNRATPQMLTEEEAARVLAVDDVPADYYLQNTRMSYHDRLVPMGFAEMTAITVGGMKIAKLFQRVIPEAVFEEGAWNHVAVFESNGNGDDPAALHDGDYATRWNTGRPMEPGDYMLFGFDAPVDYDYFSFTEVSSVYDYPQEMFILTSADGVSWTNAAIGSPIPGDYRLASKPEPYRFLRLENSGDSEQVGYWWTVAEMRFGHAK